MRVWFTAQLVRAMDLFAYWLLADQKPTVILGYGPPTLRAANE
jgi:hypothetical protein